MSIRSEHGTEIWKYGNLRNRRVGSEYTFEQKWELTCSCGFKSGLQVTEYSKTHGLMCEAIADHLCEAYTEPGEERDIFRQLLLDRGWESADDALDAAKRLAA